MIFVCSAVFVGSASAMGADRGRAIFIGVGEIFQNAGDTAVDTTGKTSLTSNGMVRFAVGSAFALDDGWGLTPVLGYTPFGRDGADRGEKSRILNFDVRATYSAWESFDLHSGPGVMLNTITGSGGTSVLNNGTSPTGTEFGLPSGSSTSRLFYWNVGAGASLADLRFDLDLLVTNVFSSRRSLFPMVTLSLGLF